MDNWSELESALHAMVASGSAEAREDGEWLAELAGLHCELRRQGKNALVHLWSDEKNLTRRILRIKEQSADRIVLEVQRFGRTKPGRLEFFRPDSPRSAGLVSREQFRARLRRFLAERFPDAVIESLSASRDLEHSFSGLYVRGRMHEGSRLWHSGCFHRLRKDAATIDGTSMTFGILYGLDWTQESVPELRAVEGLRLFVPQGTSRSLCERVLALSPAARTEVFEFSETDSRIWKMDPADAGTWKVDWCFAAILSQRLRPRSNQRSLFVPCQQGQLRRKINSSRLKHGFRLEQRKLHSVSSGWSSLVGRRKEFDLGSTTRRKNSRSRARRPSRD